jgi:hypothetical protein
MDFYVSIGRDLVSTFWFVGLVTCVSFSQENGIALPRFFKKRLKARVDRVEESRNGANESDRCDYFW